MYIYIYIFKYIYIYTYMGYSSSFMGDREVDQKSLDLLVFHSSFLGGLKPGYHLFDTKENKLPQGSTKYMNRGKWQEESSDFIRWIMKER